MPENLGAGVGLLQLAERLSEGKLLLGRAVIDALALIVNATDVGNIDGLRVKAFDTVANLILGEEVMKLAVGGDDIMVSRI